MRPAESLAAQAQLASYRHRHADNQLQYLLVFDWGQVQSAPGQLPVTAKLVSAQNPFALFWVFWHNLNSIDPGHPFDDLRFIPPEVPCFF